ncbi:hypothetical protein, partial [Pseudomonas viridiflava]|uniref:hypothetical protein n=1 Tax=Pseudomonas viridiflava TaxID=33069 RepID=UPI00198029A1
MQRGLSRSWLLVVLPEAQDCSQTVAPPTVETGCAGPALFGFFVEKSGFFQPQVQQKGIFGLLSSVFFI